MLNPWLRVNRDGSLTLLVDRSEMGQGVITGLAMLAAEELELELERIRVEFAPAAPEYANPLIGEQLTGGSTSIRAAWDSLRRACAATRERLIAAAAERWDVRRSECRAESGEVVHRGSGRRAPYAALAAAAAAGRARRAVKLKQPHAFRLIGSSPPRLEIPDLALGRAVFAMDVTRPSAVEAVLARCPSFGGRVARFDARQRCAYPCSRCSRSTARCRHRRERLRRSPAATRLRSNDLARACRLDSDAIRARQAALARRGATAQTRRR
jgi:isoquinoline 1-oxidoreductase beta subunit